MRKILENIIYIIIVVIVVWGLSHLGVFDTHLQITEKQQRHTDTQDREIISLKKRVYQLEKDKESLLNYYCLKIQHYKSGNNEYQIYALS